MDPYIYHPSQYALSTIPLRIIYAGTVRLFCNSYIYITASRDIYLHLPYNMIRSLSRRIPTFQLKKSVFALRNIIPPEFVFSLVNTFVVIFERENTAIFVLLV